MPAYVIVDIEVSDPEKYEEYKKLAQSSLAVYGGRYLVRGGRTEPLEGSWAPKRLVILEFDSAARAKEWYTSPEYGLARATRRNAARFSMLLVEGLA
jgi:uncharacterized protein (DUF1330 family)